MNRVVLISQQGSGTHLLRAFLNSHPDIYFADEIFCHNREFNQYEKSEQSVPVFLESFYNKHPKVIVGFDLKYNQINSEIVEQLKRMDVTVIHLIRNPGRTYLRCINEINTDLKYEDLIWHKKFVDKKRRQVNDLFNNKGHEFLEITYEEMTLGREITVLPAQFSLTIQNFLGVKQLETLIINQVGHKKDLKIRF